MNSQILIEELSQIDYKALLSWVPCITLFVANRMHDRHSYKLVKEAKPYKISKVKLPPEIVSKQNIIDEEKLQATILKDKIKEFAIVITNNFDDTNLRYFYNNINKLKTKYMRPIKGKNDYTTVGIYIGFINHLKVVKSDISNSTIYHELFHMTSACYNAGVIFSGFSQSNFHILSKIGNGLNEGYTELMTERYFKVPEEEKIYDFEVSIASHLDKIIGKDKMESMYLNADLYGLIQELKQYETEDNVMQFIANLDAYTYRAKLGNLNKKVNKETLENHIRNIHKFLCICYLKKIRKQIQNGQISKSNFDSLVKDFVYGLHFYLVSGNVILEDLFSIDMLHETMKDVFGDIVQIEDNRIDKDIMRK